PRRCPPRTSIPFPPKDLHLDLQAFARSRTARGFRDGPCHMAGLAQRTFVMEKIPEKHPHSNAAIIPCKIIGINPRRRIRTPGLKRIGLRDRLSAVGKLERAPGKENPG